MTKKKVIFFDLDGVLLDSLSVFLQFCNDQNEKYKLNLNIPTEEKMKYLLKTGLLPIRPMNQFLQFLGFPKDIAEEVVKYFRREYAHVYKASLFRGVKNLLLNLNKRNATLGIITLNTYDTTASSLGTYFKYFDPLLIFTVNTIPNAKLKHKALQKGIEFTRVKNDEVLFIGDQISDYEAAKKVNVPFLGVSYGWGFPEQDDIPIVHKPKEIFDFVKNGNR